MRMRLDNQMKLGGTLLGVDLVLEERGNLE